MKKVELIKETELDFSPYYAYGEEFTSYRLNMSVVEAFELLGLKSYHDFYPALLSLGAKEPFAVIASEQDVADMERIETLNDEDEQDRMHDVLQVLINLCYRDFPFEVDGRWGLKSSTGKVVVPPLFDECRGADGTDKIDTLAVVRVNDKWWLTPRNNSGKLVTDKGYDSISRSSHYAWVKNDGKVGLLSAVTGEVLIPCEQDWMEDAGVFFLWCIGKGDKIGIFDVHLNPFTEEPTDDKFYPTIYDAIDASTGKICLNGKWGWLLKDGTFTDKAPKCYDTLIFPSQLPLNSDAENLKWMVEKNGIGNIPGVKHIRMRCGRGDSTKITLSQLKESDVMVDIDPVVAEKFSGIVSQPQEISVEMPGDGIIIAELTPTDDDKWNIIVSWTDNNQKDMAYDCAFPLINACHRIVYSMNGIYHVDFKIDMKNCDLALPQRFISALMIYRSRKQLFVKKFDNSEFRW